jgi:hypothetical protein
MSCVLSGERFAYGGVIEPGAPGDDWHRAIYLRLRSSSTSRETE